MNDAADQFPDELASVHVMILADPRRGEWYRLWESGGSLCDLRLRRE